jgi:hypothetical protein
MTAADVLADLLARVAASKGQALFIGAQELSEWPAAAVATMKAQKLLVRARPAASVECPGCERACAMPIHVVPGPQGGASRAFVVCDKRDDINRVSVPIAYLEQWRVSGDISPASVAQALGVPLPTSVAGARLSRQSGRDAAIRGKYEELANAGKRNYVKEIQRTVQGAESLDPRSIRRIVHGR